MNAKYIITTNHNDQGWIDAFNHWNNSNYKMDQEIQLRHILEVQDEINRFNNGYAHGPAIGLVCVYVE